METSRGLAELNAAAETLWTALQADHPGLSFEVLPTVDSTNSHALRLGRQGADAPVVVVAWNQTAGRGRAGRTWQAQPGESLTFSLALPLALSEVPGGGSALSLAVGLAVAEALETRLSPNTPTQGLSIGLKWPNDLWVHDRKLGGILIEAVTSPSLAPQQRWVVIGVGLNLAGTPPEALATRCDLHALAGPGQPPPAPAQALMAVLPALLQAVSAFQLSGFAPLQPRYAARDVLKGRPVSLWRTSSASPAPGHADNADAQGMAMGVDGQGGLLIDDGLGQVQPWCVGEVSVRPQAADHDPL